MRAIWYTGVATVSLIAAAPALAQDAGAGQAATAGNAMGGAIVVTARRREEDIQDVPISISIFSQQELADRNIVSAGDIATYTPSLSADMRYGSEKTSFSIRGFNQENGTAPSVGVYFADVPALRAQGGTTTGNGAGPGAFFDLENVQVLKGPQGTLFGRNTSGGAVLLVPRKPTADFEGYVEASIGNYDMRRIQAVVNVPVMDTLRIRLGVDRQVRDGFIANYSGIGPDAFSDMDYISLRFSAVADLTPDLENYTIVTYSKSDTNAFLPRVFACDPARAAVDTLASLACDQVERTEQRGFHSAENATIDPYLDIESWQIINRTTWAVSDNVTLKNIASYGEFYETLRSTVYGENLIPGTGPDAGLNAFRVISDPYPGMKNVAQSTLTEEIQLQGSSFDERLTWQTGFYYENSEPLGFSGVLTNATAICDGTNPFNDCRAFTPSAGAGLTSSSLSAVIWKYYFQDYGVYAQSTYDLTDSLSLTGGIRYTWDNYQLTTQSLRIVPFPPVADPAVGYCSDDTAFGAPGSPTNDGSLTVGECETYVTGKSRAPTWVIDLDFKPTPDILLYAKYARGYRQGQLRVSSYGRQAHGPEKIDSYEIGFKSSWRGAVSGRLNIAAFYNDFTDQQVFATAIFRDPTLTPKAIIVNAGSSRIAGVEVDGSVSPFEGLSIDFGYTYLDTKVLSLTPPEPDAVFASFIPSGALEDYPLTNSPRHKFTISGNYTLPLDSSIGRITLGATYAYIGERYSTYSDVPYIETFGRDLGLLPSLGLLNLNLNWRDVGGQPFDLALFATNVTKEEYAASVLGGVRSFGFEAMSVGEPRMYGLRLKYKFGR